MESGKISLLIFPMLSSVSFSPTHLQDVVVLIALRLRYKRKLLDLPKYFFYFYALWVIEWMRRTETYAS